MHWLIVEDALRDRKGHWFEYLSTFDRELRALGDEVSMLADRHAEPFVIEQLRARPVLPPSIWHRMSDGAGVLTRYLRVPVHAWDTYRAVRKFLGNHGKFDVVFVPTVLVHHLLGWVCLIKRWKFDGQVILFFPNLPLHLAADGTPIWNPSPTTRLLGWLLAWLRPELESGRVILGAETHPMRTALATLTGLPVTYFPHPVAPDGKAETLKAETLKAGKREADGGEASDREPATRITMACYGPARLEKGSDILMRAIGLYLKRYPESRVRFVFQWLEDFRDENGEWVRLDPALLQDPRVEVVQRLFGDGEYARYLARTNVMLLPYRRSTYGLRVSRVVIEAMTAGLPVVATQDTTLYQQAAEFGSCLGSADGKVESLMEAIHRMASDFTPMQVKSKEQQAGAVAHFSVRVFRERLLAPIGEKQVGNEAGNVNH